MIPPEAHLSDRDRATFLTMVAFLNGRLSEKQTIDWALHLRSNQTIERMAIANVLRHSDGKTLKEPWASAWRLIDESWSEQAVEEGPSTEVYGLRDRLRSGDRSGALVAAIASLVAPRLEVKPIDSLTRRFAKIPSRPKTAEHLLRATLTSGELIDNSVIDPNKISEVSFLKSLAVALEANVNRGLDIARRLGWNDDERLWQLGDLKRVYYLESGTKNANQNDPDKYHQGIAPTVKFLFEVVSRIAQLSPNDARIFARRWKLDVSPIYVRLWAAMSRNPVLVDASQVQEFLIDLSNRRFWDIHNYPEVFELRALRFGDFEADAQKLLIRKIRKGPPRSHWPKDVTSDQFKQAKLFWVAREFRRIEAAGSELPVNERNWLSKHLPDFPELSEVSMFEGFPGGVTVRSRISDPDTQLDLLRGAQRLQALEEAFSSNQSGLEGHPAVRASDWLQVSNHSLLILQDFEEAKSGDEFPNVWDRYGSVHSPNTENDHDDRDLQDESDRTLRLLNALKEETISEAIDGISRWIEKWSRYVLSSPLGLEAWQKLYPLAVKATNSEQNLEDETKLNVSAVRAYDSEREPLDIDTLNTPVGRLVGVFLDACPSLSDNPSPFAKGSTLEVMRDIVIGSTDRSGLIARHRLIEHLPYFLSADRAWADEQLVSPLRGEEPQALALWRALARRTQFSKVLKYIGDAMAERAVDMRLGRRTRRSLVFSLVIEALHAFRESREPVVSTSKIQQMLRSLDDEVRAEAATAIWRFVAEVSEESENEPKNGIAADLYRTAAEPFLQSVWPQERSLTTPGVSKCLARLPAVSGQAFAEAVSAVERFIVPFDVWSLSDIGIKEGDDKNSRLSIIDEDSKARALLSLLDLAIDSKEGAVVPYDLSDALDRVSSISAKLSDDPKFRRLSTLARP